MSQFLRFLGALIAVVLAAVAWQSRSSLPPGPLSTSHQNGASLPDDSDPRIRVASFNIQVFGRAKFGKPEVIEILAQVVRRFDVVAVQEIRCSDPSLLPNFVNLVNANGAEYDFVIGPRLGRTVCKEQYAYIYNTRRIEVIEGSVFTVPDPQDRLHREPFVATFRVRGPPPTDAMSFTLVNIHTDPDEARDEVNLLDDVLRAIRRYNRSEDDVILLGDVNVDERDYGDLLSLPDLDWAIRGACTNTRQTECYDNIFFDRRATSEFTGAAGVFDLMSEFNLTLDEALDVSDHLPVWAAFEPLERSAVRTAARDEPTRSGQ